MDKVSVLQIHNLNIGPLSRDDPYTTLRNLLVDQKLVNKIDYLVVCGNFTCDRSLASFQHAQEVLHKIAREFLSIDGPLANRVVLVPGPQDVDDPNADSPDFAAFRQFYESFFRDRLHVEKTFDPQRAELRELKDLTLVALTYWRSTDPEVSQRRIHSFGKALDGAIRSMSSLAYVNTTPTLLVSAGTPLFPNGTEWPGANTQAQKVFNADLRISFHLFGDGPLAYVPPEPFSRDHVSLGLGSEAVAGSLWPLRVNVLELNGNPTTGQRLGVDWTVLRKGAIGRDWEWKRILGALEAKNVPTLEPKFEDFYFDFLVELSSYLSQPESRMIHVQGFPGSGISEVFTRLTEEALRKIGGRQICIHRHRWQDECDFEKFLADISTRVGPRSGGAAHLAVLYDPSYLLIAKDSKEERLKTILESCEEFFENHQLKVVYFTNFADLSFDLKGQRKILPFRALNPRIVTDLLGRYTCRVPLRGGEVANLTGGYAGLSERCLRNCALAFADWSGARVIDEKAPGELLSDSFGNGEVLDTCERLLASIKLLLGASLVDEVRKKVLEHYEGRVKGESPSPLPSDVGSDVDALAGNDRLRKHLSMPIEVDLDASTLVESDKLRRHLSIYPILKYKGGSRYEVKVVAPFLGRPRTTVFFSYHSDDADYVKMFRQHLREKSRQEGSTVQILDYRAEDWPVEAAITPQQVWEKLLLKAPNLCVFLPNGTIDKDSVNGEVRVWQQEWSQKRPGQSAGIVIIPESCEVPLGLRSFTPVDVQESFENVATAVFHALVFSEMNWGFDREVGWR
jgi:hypothetical protein